jgi:hypothetical protein
LGSSIKAVAAVITSGSSPRASLPPNIWLYDAVSEVV